MFALSHDGVGRVWGQDEEGFTLIALLKAKSVFQAICQRMNVEIAEKTYTVEKRADWRNHRSKFACLCK